MAIILITGGARSGKSQRAESRARAFPGQPVYVATAEALDGEMEGASPASRAARSRLDRTRGAARSRGGAARNRWRRRAAGRLPDAVALQPHACGARLGAGGRELADRPAPPEEPVVLVTNEVGLGIVPDNALARSFRDAAGIMNQTIAAVADEVEFVVAGLPMKLK